MRLNNDDAKHHSRYTIRTIYPHNTCADTSMIATSSLFEDVKNISAAINPRNNFITIAISLRISLHRRRRIIPARHPRRHHRKNTPPLENITACITPYYVISICF